ncbi:TetR/AcrR family transcriptional regulator [Herbiconiux daphne]|uniref:TetR/AcrR family transcriptional regulator n=1 Tax=Herbiconiux daphne TaxID=2970914 RepID=A0ABT2GZT5_9MICO|nr:TetR/AcrR family transcriptional regulator [Herbiconiux daphne]MCS5733474.1 TetR/AcrR family transcriptional regulator [Herbiconiux daphne]
MQLPKARTARALARDQITADILAAARRRLADEGPAELSLRAVARDVGMVSSAVYRYFASRDDLLTALLVLAYDDLGSAAEEGDAAVSDRDDFWARWSAALRAIRRWAVANPGDYALLYGSPVPGYAAPQTTIEPAVRVILVILGVVTDAHRAGAIAGAGTSATMESDAPGAEGLAASVAEAIDFVRARGLLEGESDVPVELVVRTLMAWTTVFGTVSFELFGHLVGSVSDLDRYFDAVIERLGRDLGLVAPHGR